MASQSRRIVSIVGARPQFIKASAVSRCITADARLTELMVHTGQHFDANMSQVFFEELEIPPPAYNLEIHGGPATAYGHALMHEFHLLAQQGYAVLYGNIRGSVGYGEAQTAGNDGRYGAGDYDDLMALLDLALERHPWLNAKRMAVIGGSYGGLMTNWIVAHTQRFRVAVTDRSICNWVSFYGTSDIGYRFAPRELRGHVPEDLERLWEVSPLKHVANVKTPCLIIHAEEDHRCPIEQAEQWFVALKRHGVPARFVRFPGENHELSRSGRPDRRVFRLREILAWLKAYL